MLGVGEQVEGLNTAAGAHIQGTLDGGALGNLRQSQGGVTNAEHVILTEHAGALMRTQIGGNKDFGAVIGGVRTQVNARGPAGRIRSVALNQRGVREILQGIAENLGCLSLSEWASQQEKRQQTRQVLLTRTVITAQNMLHTPQTRNHLVTSHRLSRFNTQQLLHSVIAVVQRQQAFTDAGQAGVIIAAGSIRNGGVLRGERGGRNSHAHHSTHPPHPAALPSYLTQPPERAAPRGSDPPTDQNRHLRKSAHPIAYTETMSNLYPDESISVDKCWERLHANTLGRLILTDGQHVDVLPVLYAVASQDDKQEIYIRTTRGNKFSSVVVSRRVAFEIDETLEDGIRSVIVVGIAHWLPPEMTPQIVRTFDLPDSETHEMQWVRIVPQTVYGREYPLLPAYLDGTHPDSDTLTS